MVTIRNRTILFFLLAIILSCSSSYATSIEKSLKISEENGVLLKLDQSGVDAEIRLFNKKNSELIRAVSFPWQKGLPEYLYVSHQDCSECRVVFSSEKNIDLKPLTFIISDITDPKEVKFWTFLNQAGELSLEAKQQSKAEKETTLSKLITTLSLAIQNSPTATLRWHAQTLLAETLLRTGKIEKQKQILKEILETTSSINGTLFRIHALYEFAVYEKDQIKRAKLYDEGILLSERIYSNSESLRLHATGINYKAVNYVQNAQYNSAFKLLEKAISLFENGQNWRFILYPLHNLSWAHQRAGNIPKSIEYAVQQRLLAQRFNVTDHQILGLYNLAMSYGHLGELAKSEQFLDLAIKQFDARDNDSDLSSLMGGYLLEERATRLLEQGAFSIAADVASTARKYFEDRAYPDRVVNMIYLQGEIDLARNKLSQARDKIQQVVQYDRANNRQRDLGAHLLKLAKLEMEQKRFLIASDYLVEALNTLAATNEMRFIAAAVVQAAQLLLNMGDLEAADTFLIDIAPTIEKYGTPIDKARFYYTHALVFKFLEKPESAIINANKAKLIVEKGLNRINRNDLRRFFLALNESIIDLNIELIARYRANNPEQSLRLAESVRARTLKTKFSLSKSQHKVNSKLKLNRKSLNKSMQKEADLWHTGKQQTAQTLARVRSLGQRLYKLEAQSLLQKKQYLSSEHFINSGIRAAANNELIAFYFLGERQSWLWLKDSKNTEIYPLPSEEEITKLVLQYRNTIDKPPSSRTSQDAWSQHDAIEALTKVLLMPVIQRISAGDIVQLTLLPDSILHGIPFFPLLSHESYNLDFSNLTIHTNISISKLMSNEKGDSIPINAKNVLVIADVKSSRELNTPTIKNTLLEANAIKAVFQDKATLLTGMGATKSKLFKQLLVSYDILHFATHGLIHADEPLLSGLSMTPDDTGHLLLAPEISNMQMQDKLIVLSACQSAFGKLISGEGLLGLTRAFMEAGAPVVIGSLWPVEDEASATLMSLFYEFLTEFNLSPAQALQAAQVKLQQNYDGQWADPYYWSGFQTYHAMNFLHNE